MRIRALLLWIEVFVLGGPTTAAVFYGFPMLLTFGISAAVNAPLMFLAGLLQLASCFYALVEYWRLAAMTIWGQKYAFGARFWAAVVGSTLGAISFVPSMSSLAVAYFVVPPLLGAIHFSALQVLRFRNSAPEGLPS